MTRSRRLWFVALLPLVAAPAVLPARARADAMVNGNRRTEMLDCNGTDAQVNGNNNRLVFHGACRTLRVNGGGNVVEVDLLPGGTVSIAGDSNRVLYAPIEPGPAVTSQGSGNQVSAGTQGEASAALAPALPDAPPAPATLPKTQVAPVAIVVLDGEGQDRDIDCTGRNVLIHGSDGRFVLRGGCRGITVQGRANRIQAELTPGAHVAIDGDAVTLNYTLTSDGPPPVVSVNGANGQLTHYSHSSSSTVSGGAVQ